MVVCVLFFCPLLGVLLFRHPDAAAVVCDQEVMLVVSPAGVLHAVNPLTKRIIWTYASGLNRGSKLPRQDSHSDDQIVFSGADRNLYVVEGSQIKDYNNLNDLLANTPWVIADRTMVIGSMSNTVFLLNKDTGAVIRKFDHLGKMWEKSERDSKKKVSTLLFSRTDYSVIVQDIVTGALLWRVTVADIKTMPLGSPRKEVPIGLFSSRGVYLKNLLPDPPSVSPSQ